MSDKEKAETRPPEPAAKAPEKEARSKPDRSGMDYVFKIVPADPKNSFDFEDVADK